MSSANKKLKFKAEFKLQMQLWGQTILNPINSKNWIYVNEVHANLKVHNR